MTEIGLYSTFRELLLSFEACRFDIDCPKITFETERENLSLKIGNTVLDYGLILAPMAGVTDRASRKICRECGAEYTVTEMVSAKAIHYNDAESLKLAAIYPDELPCAVQLFGHEPDIIAEAAEKICSADTVPTAIDINMGCPMKKIVSNGDGSALMKSPELAGEVIKAAVSASSVPVTVKFRTGWDSGTKNAVRMAEIAEKSGAALICVHGRTREEMYAPPVDRETIAAVKRAVSVPVIANGGIFSAEDALSMLVETGCDGLMIARGAMGNPWLFDEIKASIDGRQFVYPSVRERLDAAMRQIRLMVEDKGEHIALLESRRQLSYYIKGLPGAAETRARLNTAVSFSELTDITNDFLKRCGD